MPTEDQNSEHERSGAVTCEYSWLLARDLRKREGMADCNDGISMNSECSHSLLCSSGSAL